MVKKILIIRLSAMGDVIFTLPVLGVLNDIYPDAEISWLVEDKASSLLMDRNDLKRVVVYPRRSIQKFIRNPLKWPRLVRLLVKHISNLRNDEYDLVLDFQGNLKSGIHTLFSKSKRKAGFAKGHVKEAAWIFTKEHFAPGPQIVHRIEKNVSLVAPDITKVEIKRPDLKISESLILEAKRITTEIFGNETPHMIIHPGTSLFGAFKRWAPEKFGDLAKQVYNEKGIKTLVTWGPGEEDLADRVVDAGGQGVKKSPPLKSLLHLAAMIKTGKIYISADSGPLHLANYIGVPCVALFGPKDPALYKPYFNPARTVRSQVECGPCSLRRCDDPICMKKLEVDQVFRSVLDLIEEDESQ